MKPDKDPRSTPKQEGNFQRPDLHKPENTGSSQKTNKSIKK